MAENTATTSLLTSHKAKPAKAPSIDDMIETYIGATSTMQLLKAIFVGLAWAFDSQQVFISVLPGQRLVLLTGREVAVRAPTCHVGVGLAGGNVRGLGVGPQVRRPGARLPPGVVVLRR
jgi:hypothetical protein